MSERTCIGIIVGAPEKSCWWAISSIFARWLMTSLLKQIRKFVFRPIDDDVHFHSNRFPSLTSLISILCRVVYDRRSQVVQRMCKTKQFKLQVALRTAWRGTLRRTRGIWSRRRCCRRCTGRRWGWTDCNSRCGGSNGHGCSRSHFKP